MYLQKTATDQGKFPIIGFNSYLRHITLMIYTYMSTCKVGLAV